MDGTRVGVDDGSEDFLSFHGLGHPPVPVPELLSWTLNKRKEEEEEKKKKKKKGEKARSIGYPTFSSLPPLWGVALHNLQLSTEVHGKLYLPVPLSIHSTTKAEV